jgi:hypothetical protein
MKYDPEYISEFLEVCFLMDHNVCASSSPLNCFDSHLEQIEDHKNTKGTCPNKLNTPISAVTAADENDS